MTNSNIKKMLEELLFVDHCEIVNDECISVGHKRELTSFEKESLRMLHIHILNSGRKELKYMNMLEMEEDQKDFEGIDFIYKKE